ncbi:MAG: hypothetical protein HY708_04670 [Ignavibacteriae bacterium]|nr:hypothetical protein [Ignavibacteriota bacterium]
MSRYRMYSYSMIPAGAADRWHIKIYMCDTYAPIVQECFPHVPFNFTRIQKGACEATIDLPMGDWARLRNLFELFKAHIILKLNEHLKKHFTDELDQCFALDFNYQLDDETQEKVYTKFGQPEYHAKEFAEESAIQELTASMASFCNRHPLYNGIDAIAAVPPNPSKTFHLPSVLVERVAAMIGKPNGIRLVTKSQDTAKAQALPVDQKIPAIAKALVIHPWVKGKRLLLIDDLYQSGSTIWAVARALKQAGAIQVLSLTCVKSWRDTDNQ